MILLGPANSTLFTLPSARARISPGDNVPANSPLTKTKFSYGSGRHMPSSAHYHRDAITALGGRDDDPAGVGHRAFFLRAYPRLVSFAVIRRDVPFHVLRQLRQTDPRLVPLDGRGVQPRAGAIFGAGGGGQEDDKRDGEQQPHGRTTGLMASAPAISLDLFSSCGRCLPSRYPGSPDTRLAWLPHFERLFRPAAPTSRLPATRVFKAQRATHIDPASALREE